MPATTTTAQQFMEIAQQIDKQLPHTEISRRTVASRAYYAAYHTAKTHCTPDHTAKKGGMHERLIRGMLNDTRSIARTAGADLRRAKKNRVKADYKLNQAFTPQDKQQALSLAHRILNTFS